MSTTTIGRGRGRGRGRGLTSVSPQSKPGPSPTQGLEKSLQPTNQKPLRSTPSPQSVQNQLPAASPVPNKENLSPPKSNPFLAAQNKPKAELLQKPASQQSSSSTQNQNNAPKNDATKLSLEAIEALNCIPRTAVSELIPVFKRETNSNTATEIVALLCDKAIAMHEDASDIIKLCRALWDDANLHALIRSPLLKCVQSRFMSRSLKKPNEFRGVVVLICELYRYLRMNDMPLKPLTQPICDILKELLKPAGQDDVFYFYTELENIGSIIEKDSPEKMEDIMNMARQIAISSGIVPAARCRLVQLIELQARGWKLNDDVMFIYDDIFNELS